MKVAITGHTKGIGFSLAQRFQELNYEVVGFSKSLGYDIGRKKVQEAILKELDNCDVFVNNAYHPRGQTALLKKVLAKWQGTNKTIIHIGSNVKNVRSNIFLRGFGYNKDNIVYRQQKRLQSKIIKIHTEQFPTRILHVIPGLVNTEMLHQNIKFLGLNLIEPYDMAKVICDILISQKNNLYIQQLQITSL